MSGLFIGLPCLLLVARLLTGEPSEPFYNNDETRHVMTGVFFADLLQSLPQDPKQFAMAYYLQYPALGIPLYPPFFYVLEGAGMTVLGPSVLIGKCLVLSFLLAACIFLFRIVRATHGVGEARIAVLVFGFSPQVVLLAGQVMLDVPMVALTLGSLLFFCRYLEGQRRWDLMLSAIMAAFAALTRYSTAYLPMTLLLLLLLRGRWRLLGKAEVVAAGVLALALVLPYYVVAANVIGWIHLRQAVGASGHLSSATIWSRWTDYVAGLPGQIGWFATAAAAVGIAARVARRSHRGAAPYIALAAGTYLTFAPLAIHGQRFVISWLPAFAVFAAEGVRQVTGWFRPRLPVFPAAAVLVLGTAWAALSTERPYLRGYEEAASYVLHGTKDSRYCLFDGALNGNFIYQIRSHDPARRLSVLRGDRVLYSVLLQPEFGYAEKYRTDAEMSRALSRLDPEYVVVEDPPLLTFGTPAGERLRRILRTEVARYKPERVIPIQTNQAEFKGSRLIIYRNEIRNPGADTPIELPLPAIPAPRPRDGARPALPPTGR